MSSLAQGTGQSIDDLSAYFNAPVLDDSGKYLRVEAADDGAPSNFNISLVPGPRRG
ncbi:MAG: hypothetical protein LBS57_01375 [Treponema sp.]|nr:hypothetical protein [Treponema sp.]